MSFLSSVAVADSIHDAAREGNLQEVQRLINEGVDVNSKAEDNQTPLHYASWHGHFEVAKLLLANGANINARTKLWNWAPLHYASDKGHLEMVKFFLENGANPNASSYGADTSLHLASLEGHFEIAKLLVKYGADVNVKTKRGRTPLHHAVFSERINIVELLLVKGADVNAVVDKFGWTPLQLAEQRWNKEIFLKLKSFQAKANMNKEASACARTF